LREILVQEFMDSPREGLGRVEEKEDVTTKGKRQGTGGKTDIKIVEKTERGLLREKGGRRRSLKGRSKGVKGKSILSGRRRFKNGGCKKRGKAHRSRNPRPDNRKVGGKDVRRTRDECPLTGRTG